MTRLPIRLRLTLALAACMAVVLAAAGVFVYLRLGESLEEQLDESLQARATALAAFVRARGGELAGADLSRDDEGFAQVLSPDGAVLASASSLGSAPLVSPTEAARAAERPFFADRPSVPGVDGSAARILVTEAEGRGGRLVLVVGASLEDRDEALAGLLAQLLVAGPVALALASVAGYLLAGAGLRPVEAMRQRAAEISSDQPAQRLPLPEAHDEIRRLGETLNAMLDRLEAGLARERRFVADASHELRTPLALLRTELELALRRPRTAEEHEAALRSAAEEVDRLTRLAEDLLVLARVDGGHLPLRLSAIEPGDLLSSVARRFAGQAADDARAIEVTGAPDAAVLGDRLRLEQALGNLVDNALRHGEGTVRLSASRANGLVVLSVGDEGTGFPPGFLPHAFEPFARADDARGGGGAGLGLAIADAVARAHGGHVTAANAAMGAVVSLALPVAEGAPHRPAERGVDDPGCSTG